MKKRSFICRNEGSKTSFSNTFSHTGVQNWTLNRSNRPSRRSTRLNCMLKLINSSQKIPETRKILHMQRITHLDSLISACHQACYHARSGRILQQSGPDQEVTPLPGIYFFDGECDPAWTFRPTCLERRIHPNMTPSAQRQLLVKAVRNQAEDGPSTQKITHRFSQEN